MPRARPLQLPHPLHSLHPLHLFRLCAVLAVAAPLLAAAGPRYTVTAVAGQDSFARGINNLGQVVGSISVADSYHAFVYAGGSLTDLGTFGGETSTAFAINDAGQVVGTSYSYRTPRRAASSTAAAPRARSRRARAAPLPTASTMQAWWPAP